MNNIIIAENLVKRFGDFTAVDDLSLSVKEGQIYGFLGPNGAGKTTTIRMLTTMLSPTSGKITIAGHDTYDEYMKVRRNLGVIQQHNSLSKDISVRENIIHHGLMQGLSRREINQRMEELVELMGLADYMERLVDELSGGWKKRVSIVCSIIHEPKILFMDEPTTGLDTQSRNALWELIRKLNRRGTTIFITTHYISEAEALCDKISIINRGKIVIRGTNSELLGIVGEVAVEFFDNDGYSECKYFASRTDARAYMQTLSEEYGVSMRRTNLEDVFLELTGRRI